MVEELHLDQYLESDIRNAKILADILSDLNTVFKPHDGQVPIGVAIFYEGRKLIVVECGRKFGKTDILCYILYRWAMTNPGTYSYYIAPWKDQIKDLVWANGRLPFFLPDSMAKKYIQSINNTEMRILFKNGSFIKCEGSDNYEKGRGYSATGIVVYDEAKDHNPNFHNAFEPNLAITDAPLVVVGTPAYEDDNLLTRLGDLANMSNTGSFFSFPSHMNPYISKDYLARKEQEFRDRGEYDVFELEYLAKRVKIGSKYIFPMLKKSMVKPHGELLEHIIRNRKDYDFFTGYDPGSVKCFAVGFFAIHRYDRHIIGLDEIYATKLGENSTRQIVPVAIQKADDINPNHDDWMDCYDYAAAWFASEVAYEYPNYPHALFPCEKDLKNKEAKISLIKDILLAGLFTLSDKCVKAYWELDNYKLDDKGKTIKENDHWIDLFRYVLNLANYSTIEGARQLEFTDRYKRGSPRQDKQREAKEAGYGDIDDYIFNG
jgi:hypothetical protein